jgi:hypothetical protein
VIIDVPRALLSAIRRSHAANLQFERLMQAAAGGRPIGRTWLKASGSGRRMTFEPYVRLAFHHAKLDPNGSHGGDPVLVMQIVRGMKENDLQNVSNPHGPQTAGQIKEPAMVIDC